MSRHAGIPAAEAVEVPRHQVRGVPGAPRRDVDWGKPRLRHDPDCGHFEWGDGTIFGTSVLATEEQMQTLKACKSCIGRGSDSRGDPHPAMTDARPGKLCPDCHQVMPLTGICDNCLG